VSTLAQKVKHYHYTSVKLAAYTDNVFSPTFNVTLNQNRASAVMHQLQGDLGALHDKKVSITILLGSVSVQLASNTTAKGRAANRHVVATLRAS
jgi:outer membrane protein OmpA-like peptidoglycan-associated protein